MPVDAIAVVVTDAAGPSEELDAIRVRGVQVLEV